ncbi:MAG: hypothetical protein AABZ60_07750, partial [Planctomycetota bacterium]
MISTTKKIENITLPQTRLEQFIEKIFPSWSWCVWLFPLMILLFEIVTYSFLVGFPEKLGEFFWKDLFLLPTLTFYLFLVIPLIKKKHQKAIQIFRPLLVRGDLDFQHLVTATLLKSRRRELFSILVFIVFGWLVFRPWKADKYWIPYLFFAQFITFGIFGWFVYISLTSSRVFSIIGRQPIYFDIFQDAPLEPVAKWSLGVCSAFIGLATLGAILMPNPVFSDWRYATFYFITLSISILIFFFGTWDTHKIILQVKENELNRVKDDLQEQHQLFKQALSEKRQTDEIFKLSQITITLLTLEKRLEDAPDWPYSADIIRNLLLS